MNRFFLALFSIILFFALFTVGIRLAQMKPLWNDELYSQTHSVENISYVEILLGHIVEGNNSPLFYVVQKVFLDVRQYKLPFQWKGEWAIADPQAQVVLRYPAIFFMALMLVIIFYIFALEYSFIAGIYALFLGISTHLVWNYWAEARPYALWSCLSAFQVLYFLRFVKAGPNQENKRQQSWRGLSLIHILLSLTAVFGTVQAFIGSMVLIVFYEKDLRKYIWMMFVPLIFGFYYFYNAQHYIFGLPAQPLTLIFDNIPTDRVLLIILLSISLLAINFWMKEHEIVRGIFHFGLLGEFLFASALGILWFLTWTQQEGWVPFTISSRYLIFLTPLGIVTVGGFSIELLRALQKNRWMTINVLIVLAGFLLLRTLRTLPVALTGLGLR